MKKPKICLSIINLKDFSLKDYEFEGYEFRAKSKEFVFDITKILELKEKFKGFDLSLHTELSRIFSCNQKGYPEFNKAELNILKAEIIVAKIIGIKQIIFHIKQEILSEEEKEKFKKIIELAKEKGIELIYESNIATEGKNILKFLEDFPEINFCLDFGHINLSDKKEVLGMELMEFIEKVKSRVVHIHAHNNYGNEDSHNYIENGSFPWKKVLGKLKDQNLRKIVIEYKKENQKEKILETKKLLEEVYN